MTDERKAHLAKVRANMTRGDHNTVPAPKADSALVGELREKAEQADAAKRNLHGLPVLAMESDTHKGKLALWCDNGLAGVGQTCVAVNLGEFPDEQIKAIAALANIAATTDFAAILAALSAPAEQEAWEKLAALTQCADTVMFLPPNDEANDTSEQTGVDCNGEWTGWKDLRFLAATHREALDAAHTAYLSKQEQS